MWIRHTYFSILLFALSILNLTAQHDSKLDLLGSNYIVTKIVFNKNDKIIRDYSKVANEQGIKMNDFKMKGFISKTTKKDGFEKGDTLIQFNWDLQSNFFPFSCISKYKLRYSDSLLMFYEIKSANGVVPNEKIVLKTRKFKIVLMEAGGFVLLDLDLKDVSRFYHFKNIKKKSK